MVHPAVASRRFNEVHNFNTSGWTRTSGKYSIHTSGCDVQPPETGKDSIHTSGCDIIKPPETDRFIPRTLDLCAAVAVRRFRISIPQVGLEPPENIQFTPLDVMANLRKLGKIQFTPLDVISSNLRKLIGSFRGHSISANRH